MLASKEFYLNQKKPEIPKENAVKSLRKLYQKNKRTRAPKELINLFRREKENKKI
jgi:hypothetical protein